MSAPEGFQRLDFFGGNPQRQDSGLVSSFVGRVSVNEVRDSSLVDVGFVAYEVHPGRILPNFSEKN